MRRMIFGLALIPLLAVSGVYSAGAQSSTESEVSQKLQPAPSTKKSKKQTSAKAAAKTQPSSLDAAESYAVQHSERSPDVSSTAKPATASPSSAGHSWTGFHVGAGVGVSAQ